MSASSKTMQGAFPPSSKETWKIIIAVSINIRRSQNKMTAYKISGNVQKKSNTYPSEKMLLRYNNALQGYAKLLDISSNLKEKT